MAYERVSGPIGSDRSDVHAGIVSSTVANAMKGKKGKKFEPKDFIPQWDKPEQTWQDQLAVVKRVHGSLTRRDRRRVAGSKRQQRQQVDGPQESNQDG